MLEILIAFIKNSNNIYCFFFSLFFLLKFSTTINMGFIILATYRNYPVFTLNTEHQKHTTTKKLNWRLRVAQDVVTSLRDKLCVSADEYFSLVLEHVKSLKRNKLTVLDPQETLARVSWLFANMIKYSLFYCCLFLFLLYAWMVWEGLSPSECVLLSL